MHAVLLQLELLAHLHPPLCLFHQQAQAGSRSSQITTNFLKNTKNTKNAQQHGVFQFRVKRSNHAAEVLSQDEAQPLDKSYSHELGG